MAGDARIPVAVITGFLGSGKTTYLRRMLGERRDDAAVIVDRHFAHRRTDQRHPAGPFD